MKRIAEAVYLRIWGMLFIKTYVGPRRTPIAHIRQIRNHHRGKW